ncbi:AAA family ATPase [Falsarthrobacter nasiphocae]|uniref:ATPase n=1 Tax=Falsarthrobacter nasiphocae TaxID=189863 RepID=A0AAE4C691_9MICC|nr:AAA family ATPase [Falsarthrobacter nasiphocae]MDR6892328.1 putative ATPase [Falsarthrobacter nasiphocae]
MRPLMKVSLANFRSFKDSTVTLGKLNVLVGPNEAGKSNFLDAIEFLGDSARDNLSRALEKRGGIERVRFRGEAEGPVKIGVTANVTAHASENAPDEYVLTFDALDSSAGGGLMRTESLVFKRTKGRGRRITVEGTRGQFIDGAGDVQGPSFQPPMDFALREDSLALSTLQNLPDDEGGAEVIKLAEAFSTFRVFNIDVRAAVQSSSISAGETGHVSLKADASNLAAVVMHILADEDLAGDFIADAREMIPGLDDIRVAERGGAGLSAVIELEERGLATPTQLADASFGTVRILALLALLYDQDPPLITCIEEIDHGLHPYVFDRLVELLRLASQRTQLFVVTHSPALVNRLTPEELIVVERDPEGWTRMPAIETGALVDMIEATDGELGLGELWFSGSLGGVPR